MIQRSPFATDNVAQQFSSDWAQQGFRSEDEALELNALVDELIDQRRHVALSSRDPDTLDHYSRLLVRDLRQRPGVKVVPYFPSSTDMLLTRLNELLAQTTIAQAMRRDPVAERVVHVFVLHDTPSLANAELTLLVQLINDLPGTELRLVLVLDSEDTQFARLPLLGKRARHWDIAARAPVDLPQDRGAPSEASGVPVLHDRLSSDGTTGAKTDERSSWWRRLWRPASQKSAAVVMAMLAMVLGSWLLMQGEPAQAELSAQALPPQRLWQGALHTAALRDGLAGEQSSPCGSGDWLGASRCPPPLSPS